MSTGKVLLGVLAGVAAGAALGILFAPEKGADTRKKIASKSDDYVDNLKGKFNDFLATVTEKFDSATNQAEDLADQGKARLQEANRNVRNVVNDASNI
ncbi:MAG: YtxH domain-containing protein [Chitinophagaceae bacterium]|nr:MAG: YtxH domain-containing protein [Chitinophagaceae bacterium]